MRLIPNWLGDDIIIQAKNREKGCKMRVTVTKGTGERTWDLGGAGGCLGCMVSARERARMGQR